MKDLNAKIQFFYSNSVVMVRYLIDVNVYQYIACLHYIQILNNNNNNNSDYKLSTIQEFLRCSAKNSTKQ